MARQSTAIEQLRKRIEAWKVRDFSVHFDPFTVKILSPIEELSSMLIDEKAVTLLLDKVFLVEPYPINTQELFRCHDVESFLQIRDFSTLKCDEVGQHFAKKAVENADKMSPWEQKSPLELMSGLKELLSECVLSIKRIGGSFGYDLDDEKEKGFIYELFKAGLNFSSESKQALFKFSSNGSGYIAPQIDIHADVASIIKNLVRRRAAICLPEFEYEWSGSVSVGLVHDVCEAALNFYSARKLEIELANKIVKLESKKAAKSVSTETKDDIKKVA